MSSSLSILIFDLFFENGQRLTLKSLFTPTQPTRKLFLVSNERYGQINTFLLRYYGTDFASIKRYDQFCFLLMYIRRHRFSPLSIFLSLLSALSPLFYLGSLFLLPLCSLSLLSALLYKGCPKSSAPFKTAVMSPKIDV